MADSPKYSDDDVRAILDRALKGDEAGANGLTHEELLAVGEQVGVRPEVMTRAAQQERELRVESTARQAISSRRRRWLFGHAALFAVINALLYAVNAATTPGEWWVLFPVFFWGLALLLHAGLALGLAVSPRALERERGAAKARLRVADESAEEVELATTETKTSSRSAS